MSLDEALFDRLSNFAGLTALVGAAADARVYPDQAPGKPVAPYLVYEVDDDEDQAHAMSVDATPRRAWCRFWCFDTTSDGVRALATQVIASLRRYNGTHAGISIDDGYIKGNRPSVDDEAKLRARLVEFEIVYH